MVKPADLSGVTALITGASSGIGAETAIQLGTHGAYVVIHYHNNLKGATEVLERVHQGGGNGELIAADLSNTEAIQQFAGSLQQMRNPIDILVNNAGSLIERKPFLEITEELWSKVFTLNLTSAFLTTQAVLPSMIQRRRGVVM